jgi:anti-sigma B factor antagonist
LDARRETGVHVVRLRGSASMDQSVALHRRLVELITADTPNLILDLTELDFISSAGLGAIVAANTHARAYGGCVRMVNPTSAIRTLLRVTHIDARIPIHDSLDAARGALATTPG